MYKDKIETVIELLGNSKADIKSHIDGISEMAALIKKDVNNDVKNVHDLFASTIIKKHFEMFYKEENLNYKNIEDLLKIGDDKIPLNVVVTLSELLIYSFIGFGYKYPELTKQLLSYKTDDSFHDLAIKSGLDIPKEKVELDIEDHKTLAKELIKPFVYQRHADLIEDLELK
jgi:hypothetical protein